MEPSEMTDDEAERLPMSPQQLADAVAFLGCAEEAGSIGDAQIEWFDAGHAGAGWYIYCGEYPDEGSSFISSDENPTGELATLLGLQDERDAPDSATGEQR